MSLKYWLLISNYFNGWGYLLSNSFCLIRALIDQWRTRPWHRIDHLNFLSQVLNLSTVIQNRKYYLSIIHSVRGHLTKLLGRPNMCLFLSLLPKSSNSLWNLSLESWYATCKQKILTNTEEREYYPRLGMKQNKNW